jgi:hypothetical protein
MSIRFWQTPMGKTFYDHTMPALVRELTRLNTNLESMLVTFWDGRLTEAREALEPKR